MIQDDVESWAIREAGVVTASGAGGELPTQQGHSAPGQVRLGRGHHSPPASPGQRLPMSRPPGQLPPSASVSWPRIHPRVGVGWGRSSLAGLFGRREKRGRFSPISPTGGYKLPSRSVSVGINDGVVGNGRLTRCL